jgi:hypothetical protein
MRKHDQVMPFAVVVPTNGHRVPYAVGCGAWRPVLDPSAAPEIGAWFELRTYA